MAFDAVLKRYFWVVLLALVAVAAYFQAAGITQVVGAAIAVDGKALFPSGTGTTKTFGAPAASGDHTQSAAKIIERNPFDSVKGDLTPPVASASASESSGPPLPPTEEPYSAPACEGVKILATAVSDDAAWSFASLSGGTGEGPGSKMKRQGDEYAGKRVWFIRWDRVWLIGPGSFCQAEMFPYASMVAAAASAAASASSKAVAPAAPVASGGKGVPSVSPEIASKIQKVSANEFNVDRTVIDKILENQTELMRAARIVPEQENGKVVGVRMFGIRSDTLLGVLGMESGDRLEKINGFEMGSPEKALEAYARLRTAEKLTVNVNRRGQPMTIDFHIK
jgi:general secretion pathway protein C